MVVDFTFILFGATLMTGLIWGVDTWVFKPKRAREAAVAGGGPAATGATDNVREPPLVENARSFFPVILIVLLIHSFLFESFSNPSDSMMPTLLDGDLIFANKYAYGLRLPIVNKKIISIANPKRGDVIVFRSPQKPTLLHIKRLVGLPGDHIKVRANQLSINGQTVPVKMGGIYEGQRYTGAHIGEERLRDVHHSVLFKPGRVNRNYDRRDYDEVVPEGYYFFLGDNRDDSRDSRYPEVWFIPEDYLVGKAVRIWFSWNPPSAPIWDRIGDPIR